MSFDNEAAKTLFYELLSEAAVAAHDAYVEELEWYLTWARVSKKKQKTIIDHFRRSGMPTKIYRGLVHQDVAERLCKHLRMHHADAKRPLTGLE